MIGPRLQLLYEWAARELDQPELLSLIRNGAPVYAWPYAQRRVWTSGHPTAVTRLLRRVTAAR